MVAIFLSNFKNHVFATHYWYFLLRVLCFDLYCVTLTPESPGKRFFITSLCQVDFVNTARNQVCDCFISYVPGRTAISSFWCK